MRRFLHQLSSWYRNWQPYFKSRAPQLLSRLWESLAIAAVVILIFSAVFSALGLFHSYDKFLSPGISGTLEGLNAVFTLISLGSALFVFCLCFALLLILSLHPKGRKIADKLFRFKDLTELEELKVKVGNIENELLSTNKRTSKKLEDVKSRLENIETILKSLASKDNHTKRHKGRGRK